MNKELFRNYVKKPEPALAKIWSLGDQDGFVTGSQGEQVPYIRSPKGVDGRQYAEFGTQYLVLYDEDLNAELIPIERFKQLYESLDQ